MLREKIMGRLLYKYIRETLITSSFFTRTRRTRPYCNCPRFCSLRIMVARGSTAALCQGSGGITAAKNSVVTKVIYGGLFSSVTAPIFSIVFPSPLPIFAIHFFAFIAQSAC